MFRKILSRIKKWFKIRFKKKEGGNRSQKANTDPPEFYKLFMPEKEITVSEAQSLSPREDDSVLNELTNRKIRNFGIGLRWSALKEAGLWEWPSKDEDILSNIESSENSFEYFAGEFAG